MIKLKKFKSRGAAIDDFDKALNRIAEIPETAASLVEKGFLVNAKNLVHVLDILSDSNIEHRVPRLREIAASEHVILQELCETFISVPAQEFKQEDLYLKMVFIINTILGNIVKLNDLVGDHDESIDLFKCYDYILDSAINRTRESQYHRSYMISLSHALLHNKIKIACHKAKARLHQQAYEITKELRDSCDQFDVTGNYRMYTLYAHSVQCLSINHKKEAIECLAEIAEISAYYNEPYFAKLAFNMLNDIYCESDDETGIIIKNAPYLDDSFEKHEADKFFVSAAIDLENSLTGGVDRLFSSSALERAYPFYSGKNDISLKNSYRTYSLWR